MRNLREKRLYHRSGYGKPVTVYLLHRPDKYFFGTMDNYSSGGMNILTTGRINPETPVVIRMHKYDPFTDGPEKNDEYYGIVTWSKALDTSDTQYRYEYGVKYDEPVDF